MSGGYESQFPDKGTYSPNQTAPFPQAPPFCTSVLLLLWVVVVVWVGVCVRARACTAFGLGCFIIFIFFFLNSLKDYKYSFL